MLNGGETLRYTNFIRRIAQASACSPFTNDAIVRACSSAELAGMPRTFRLATTAQEYAVFASGEQLAVTLAGRVGNPRVSPVPPVWPVLALLLLGWRNSFSIEKVMERSAPAADHDVQLGFAIVGYLFPELENWIGNMRLKIPLWERRLAVPLAARKLVLLDKMD
jgi:hypothetical protein